jgi:glycosyltransferase involved in cell wall biosynthesis
VESDSVQLSLEKNKTKPHRKLLFVTNSARYFFHHRIRLAKFAKNKGFEIGVVAVTDSEEHKTKILAEGFQYFEIPLKRNSLNPFREIITFIKIGLHIVKFKPSILHSLTIKAVIYSGILCRILGVPMVGLIPGRGAAFITPGIKGKFLRILATKLYRVALKTNTICPCFENQEDLEFFRQEGMIPQNAGERIFGAGVDVSNFASESFATKESVNGNKLVVLMACRLLRDKGVVEFLNAATLVQKVLPHVEFQLAGEPDLQNPNSLTLPEVEQLCLVNGVSYLGFQNDMKPVLENCSLFCLPSYYGEGVPVAVLEAMSMRRAVITTHMPGCRDAVEDGVNGYLVEPKNVEALANAIETICKNAALCEKMGIAGRQRVERYFKDANVHEKYLDVYDSLEEIQKAG